MPLNNTMYQGPAARGRPLLPGCVLSLGSAAFTIAATPVFGLVLEEVVVTAQHRTQSMQDVPIAITAFDAATIEKAKIDAMEDIVINTPGLSATPYSQVDPQLFIRGIGSTDDGAGGDPSVLVFQDDVVMARASGASLSMFDVARIEVLRGPQGTLYGKNAAGGVINIITRSPEDERTAAVEITPLGNYDRFETRAMVNVPLSDAWQFRVAGSTTYHEGFNKSLTTGRRVDEEDNKSFRSKLRYLPTDTLDAIFAMNYSNDSSYGNTRKPLPAGSFATNSGALNIDPDPRKRQPSDDGYLDREIRSYALTLNWDIAFGTITSITAYREVEVDWFQDLSGMPVPPGRLKTQNLWREETQQSSQELRWAAEALDGRLNWVTGAFFLSEEIDREEEFIRTFFRIPGNPPGQLPQVSNPVFVQNNESQSYAVFGQFTYTVFDSFDITLGARYTQDEKDIDLAVTDLLRGTSGSLAPALEEYAITTDESWNEVTPRAAIDYRFSDEVMIYASVSKGYKAGGFQTAPASAAEARISYDPEAVIAYEIGTKTEWLDRRLRVNVAGFYSDYSDLQVLQLVEAVKGDPSTLVLVTDNAAEAEITGIEVEILAQPTEALTLGGTYAYLDTEFTDYLTNTGADLAGNKLRRTPDESYTLYGEYAFHLADSGGIVVRGEYSYVGDQYFENDNRAVSLEPDYSVVNASVRYISPGDNWEVVLWGKNLDDELYRVNSISVADSGFSRIGPPRTWGLTFKARLDW